MTATSSKFTIRRVDGAEVFELTRPDLLDAVYIKQLGDEIYHTIEKKHGVKIVVDFSEVKALSSAALGMVVALHKVVAKLNGQLGISNLTDEIHRAFKLTKLNKMIRIYDTVPTAVASFE